MFCSDSCMVVSAPIVVKLVRGKWVAASPLKRELKVTPKTKLLSTDDCLHQIFRLALLDQTNVVLVISISFVLPQ